jgi:hypothetical protein
MRSEKGLYAAGDCASLIERRELKKTGSHDTLFRCSTPYGMRAAKLLRTKPQEKETDRFL